MAGNLIPQEQAEKVWAMLEEYGIRTLEELNDRYTHGQDINMAIFRQA